jgi:hypothetical protein
MRLHIKWNQLAVLNVVLALALWVSPASEAFQTYLQPINFKLTLAQQQVETHTNAYPSFSINTVKLTNKSLLGVLASAFDTNWPAGADLAMDRFSGNLYVVDATGTNPVFNVSQGVSVDETNVAFFRCEFDLPVSKNQTLVRARPGGASEHSIGGTRYGMVFFQLFIEQDGVTNADLSFAGLNTADFRSHFIQSSNVVPAFTDYSYQTKETMSVMGDGVFDEAWSVVEGTVTSQLELKGISPVGTPIMPPPQPPPQPPIIFPPPPPNLFTNGITNIVILPPIRLTNAP